MCGAEPQFVNFQTALAERPEDEALRAAYEDFLVDYLQDRAERAGWVWFEGVTDKWPGTKTYPVTGWKHGNSFSDARKEGAKTKTLRADKDNPGFEHAFNCVECQQPIWLKWLSNKELIKKQKCFDCNYWLKFVGRKGVVVKNESGRLVHYQIGDETGPESFRGFGGSKFCIQFHDGRHVVSTNLWHQGEIPERFWDRLPANASFAPSEKNK